MDRHISNRLVEQQIMSSHAAHKRINQRSTFPNTGLLFVEGEINKFEEMSIYSQEREVR